MSAEVIYTRSDDTFVPLETRTQIANLKKADRFSPFTPTRLRNREWPAWRRIT